LIAAVNRTRYDGDTGFTLIELLMVIAIILVLIAIALPNFLEAQIRARVTKVHGDMHNVATALEAYRIDWLGEYPWASEYPRFNMPARPRARPIELCLSTAMTTPVAYIPSLVMDTFSTHSYNRNQSILMPLHYTDQFMDDYLGVSALIREMTTIIYSQPRSAEFILLSHGPDNDHDNFQVTGPDGEEIGSGDGHDGGERPQDDGALYSATNGTRSSGDIYYFGPGIGFD